MAHAVSGRKIPSNETEEYLIPYRIARWKIQFDSDSDSLRQEPAKKVFIKMKAVDVEAEIRSLIIFWDAIHPEDKPEPRFNVKVKNLPFDSLWVFSMSTYVRNLINQGIREIRLDMPGLTERLNWLNILYKGFD